METKFNFNSQVCTSKVQSERLLALGLKKETADCYWFYCDIAKEWKCTILSSTQVFKDYPTTVIPAWSLHRLIEMMPDTIAIENATCMGHRFFYLLTFVHDFVTYEVNSSVFKEFAEHDNYYDNLIDCIAWLIKEGYFNKEYLEDGDN